MWCVAVGVCRTSQYTPDVEIPVLTYCHGGCLRDSAGKGSTSPAGDVRPPLLRRHWRVWCRRRRSSTVVFHVVPPSCDPDAMQKSITFPPRDPDVISSEITPTVYQLRSYPKGAVLFLLVCKLLSLPGLPAIVSPVVTSQPNATP